VLNGIDTALWDPAADAFLPAPYSAAAPGGKALCKRCAGPQAPRPLRAAPLAPLELHAVLRAG